MPIMHGPTVCCERANVWPHSETSWGNKRAMTEIYVCNKCDTTATNESCHPFLVAFVFTSFKTVFFFSFFFLLFFLSLVVVILIFVSRGWGKGALNNTRLEM